MEQNFLGNLALFDGSIIIFDAQGVQLYVGMPVSILKEHYPISYRYVQNVNNNEDKNLRKVSLISEVIINGKSIPADFGGLTIIYNNDTGKVERINSSW